MKILVTGGAGFIGSNFIRYLLKTRKDIQIINLDKLTYSGNLENLRNIETDKRYTFIKGDITDKNLVESVFKEKINIIINFAAETHVDRSISKPDDFIKTDIIGTYTLLEASKKHGIDLFIQISTDEVYGHIAKGSADEDTTLKPTNPYSASKAGADRLAYSYWTTYELPVIITRTSNNFGPFQYPEKIVPLFITNILEDQILPVYGDGLQIRDWIYVEDHCKAIDFLITKGIVGEVYNIGGGNLLTNLELTRAILKELEKPYSLIKHIKDRPGHDRRYSLNSKKITKLGWRPSVNFKEGLSKTINWYKENPSWWQKIKSGVFKDYYKQHYSLN